MKFNQIILSLLFLTTAANAVHTSSRKVFATDITNKSGTSVFYFPTSLPLASRACIMNSDREITSSSVTDTELGYLSGVTSAIQTQLDAKYSGLPSQTGNSGKYLTTNGTIESWATVAAGITDLTGGVTASGTGSVAATVASVGGKTAAQVGTSVDDTLAAASANTASVIVKRDSSKNFLINNVGTTTTSTTSSNNATLTLTAASSRRQRIGGTGTNYRINLPDCTTLGQAGFSFYIDNRSSQTITIRDTSSNDLYTMPSLTAATVIASSVASANGSWEIETAIGQPATDSAPGYFSAADHSTLTTLNNTVGSATHANTASAIVKRTADGNVWTTGAQQKATSTATAAGTTTLTVADSPIQIWTGSTTQTIKMPAANTLVQIGATYRIINKSSGIITVQDNSANAITTVAGGTAADIIVTNIGSAAGTWIANAASAGAPSLTDTYVGFGAGGVLSGSSDFIWDDTNKNLKINVASGSATSSGQLQFLRDTTTGTTSSDGLKMGFVDASSATFKMIYQEGTSFVIYRGANAIMLNNTSVNRLSNGSGTGNGTVEISNTGIGLGGNNPSAVVHIKVGGTTAANTAPLKLTSGTNMTTAEAGAMEYDGTLWFSPSTATERFAILQPTGASKPTCSVTYRGQHWVTPGGAGVADILEFCLKDAADAYAWVTK